jgi:hypothetical protein
MRNRLIFVRMTLVRTGLQAAHHRDAMCFKIPIVNISTRDNLNIHGAYTVNIAFIVILVRSKVIQSDPFEMS